MDGPLRPRSSEFGAHSTTTSRSIVGEGAAWAGYLLGHPGRWTLRRKMWSLVGLLCILLLASNLFMLHRIGSLEHALYTVAVVEDPTNVAAYEMEINALGTGFGVLKYLETGRPEYRSRVQDDADDFARFHASFTSLAEDTDEQRQAVRIGELYTAYVSLGRSLMDERDGQFMLLQAIEARFKQIDELIDDRIQARIDHRRPDSSQKVLRSAELNTDLADLGTWLGVYLRSGESGHKARLLDEAEEFRRELEHFQALDLTAEERQWTAEIADAFGATEVLTVDVLGRHDKQLAQVQRFLQLREEIDVLLDEEIQLHTAADLGAAVGATAHLVGQMYGVSVGTLLVGLLIAVGAARFVQRSMIGPLYTLSERVGKIGTGAGEDQTPVRQSDEIENLIGAFNVMVQRRRDVEVALRSSEDQYRAVSELTSDYVYSLRVAPDGAVRTAWITNSFTRITGYEVDDVIDQGSWTSFIEPEDHSIYHEHLAEVFAGRNDDLTFRIRTAAGHIRWFHDIAQPISDGGQVVGILGAVRDITEHKQAELALQESEARFRLLVEHVQEYAIYMLDPAGHVVTWNAGAERIKGYTAAEILGQSFTRFYLPEDLAAGRAEKALAEATSAGHYSTEGWRVRNDGTRFWATVAITAVRDGTGTLRGFTKITRDMSEQKQTYDRLHLRDRAIAAASNGIVITDARQPDYPIIYCNPAFLSMTGYREDEVVGNNSRVLDGPATDRDVLAMLHAARAANQECHVELVHYRKDGTSFWSEVTQSPVRDPKGQVVNFVAVLTDITARKAAEGALRESQQALALHVQHTPLAYIEWDRSFNVREWNAAAERMFGWRKDEALGRHASDLIVPEAAREVVNQVWHSLLAQSGGSRSTNENLRRDGATISCEWYNTPLVDSSGVVIGVASLVQDITEQQQAQKALRDHQQFTERVTDTIPGLVYVFDLVEQCNVYTNRHVGELLGYSADEVQAMGAALLPSVVHPEDLPAIIKQQERLVQGDIGATLTITYRIRRSDGELRWLEDRCTVFTRGPEGQALQLLGYAEDVTARTQAVAELGRSQARFAGILDSAMDAIVTIDDGQRVRLFNRAAEQMFGFTAAEMLGEPIDRLLPDAVRATHSAHVHSFGKSGTTSRAMRSPGRLEGRRADGSLFPIEASISQITIGNEQLYTVIVRDVTERQRLEAQLRHVQKMESVGQLAGGIAHDFNNLLMAVLGYADMALGGVEAESPVRDDLHEIQKAGLRASALTQQLLAFARKQVIAPRVVDLNDLLLNLSSLLRRLMQESIELVVLPRPEKLLVNVDPGQIEQVLVNLAVNARDAMPEGGTLAIAPRLLLPDGDPALEPLGLAPGCYVGLTVTDTGVGMAEEVRQQIFEPFFTTKAPGQGTGLGLATCYGILKQHGGAITCESALRQGTTFTVYLRLEETAVPEPVATHPTGDLTSGKETVLLVEDEAMVRTLASRVLRSAGYTVIEAAHGVEAMALLEGEAAAPIRLVLTDMVMPQLGGRVVAEHIRAARPDVKLILMSGYTDTVFGEDGQMEAGTTFLQKPFTPQTLLHKVRERLDT